MNKTTNYQLNQWERTDRVLMEDFNADNAKLDAAIKAQADALATEKAAREAAVQSINTTLSGAVKVAAGSYTGDGSASRTIYTGFTPRAVLVHHAEGPGNSNFYRYDGLAVAGGPMSYGGVPFIEVVSGGFRVAQNSSGSVTLSSNKSNVNYRYLAIG